MWHLPVTGNKPLMDKQQGGDEQWKETEAGGHMEIDVEKWWETAMEVVARDLSSSTA